MNKLIKRNIRRVKLCVLWVKRILLAENHFKVNFFTKLRMNICGGYLADQYVLYDLAHNNKNDYLSEFDWYRSRWINEPFDSMLNNKVVCTKILEGLVHTPRLLLLQSKGRIISLEPGMGDGYKKQSDVIDLLRRYDFVFLKPLAAGKGKGVHRLELLEESPAVDGKKMSEPQFFKFLEDADRWFLSEGVKQHSFLDSIYDKTTNTIRFITLRDPESGRFKVFFAVLRIGTSDTIPVDNGSKGGLVSKINLTTGELSEARSLHSLEAHEHHPDSGFPIKGSIVPHWQEIKEKMLDLARTLPFINFIAWDILLTEQGVCIIEANTSSGVNIIQLWGPQKNDELGDFYRAHGAIRSK